MTTNPVDMKQDEHDDSSGCKRLLLYGTTTASSTTPLLLNDNGTVKFEEVLAHADLSDMPDTGGTNSDHDSRYYTETEMDVHTTNSALHFTEASIDHDVITNTHNLTTDIDHDTLTNYTSSEHFLKSDINLDDLGNVTTSSIADNELLAYDTSSTSWINQTPTEAGLDSVYLKLDGSNANSNINIASYDLTTTGDITAGDLKISGSTIYDLGTTSGINIDEFVWAGGFAKNPEISFEGFANVGFIRPTLYIRSATGGNGILGFYADDMSKNIVFTHNPANNEIVISSTLGSQTLRIAVPTTISRNLMINQDNIYLKIGATNTDLQLFSDGTDGNITTTGDLEIGCGTDKTIELQETVYRDINMAGYLLTRPTSNQPDIVSFVDENGDDTTIETYGFGTGEKVHGGFELQHDYAEGTDLVFHVHWQGVTAPSGTDNVQWRLNYILMRDGETLNAAVEIDSPDTPIDTRYSTERTDFTAITGTNFKIGDQFMFTLTRTTATANEYAGDALIATAGIHYEVDTIGSRQITTK